MVSASCVCTVDGAPSLIYYIGHQLVYVLASLCSRDEDQTFFSSDPDPDPAKLKKNPDPKKVYVLGR